MAPTSAVRPESASAPPNPSPTVPSDGVSSASSVQLPPDRRKTYTAPAPPPAPVAPTRRVDPESATAVPKESPATPFGASSSACSDQVEPDCTNTYTAPVD